MQQEMRSQRIALESYEIDKVVTSPFSITFSPGNPSKLVPAFEFFNRFEKLVAGKNWPKESRSTLVLTGKALTAIVYFLRRSPGL